MDAPKPDFLTYAVDASALTGASMRQLAGLCDALRTISAILGGECAGGDYTGDDGFMNAAGEALNDVQEVIHASREAIVRALQCRHPADAREAEVRFFALISEEASHRDSPATLAVMSVREAATMHHFQREGA